MLTGMYLFVYTYEGNNFFLEVAGSSGCSGALVALHGERIHLLPA